MREELVAWAVTREIMPIGTIHSPHKRAEDITHDCSSVEGEIEIFPKYGEGLNDIEGFSHLFVLWHFHLSERFSLMVKPLYYEGKRGVFATRHPDRPTPIGLTVVELFRRRGNVLDVRGIDALDGTPVLDIKPYLRRDMKEITSSGWLEDR